jgi:hypothetical protein
MSRSEFKTPSVQRTSRWRVFLFVIAVLAAIVWAIVAAKTRDPLWLLGGSYIPAPPSRIAIHAKGEMQTILPGDPEYDPLSDAILASVGELDSPHLVDVGLSEETLNELLTQSTAMEVFFPEPLRYHAAVRIVPPDKLLIPLKGHHAGRAYMFLGNGETPYRPGALRMQDDTPLREVLAAMGIDIEEPGTGSAVTDQP